MNRRSFFSRILAAAAAIVAPKPPIQIFKPLPEVPVFRPMIYGPSFCVPDNFFAKSPLLAYLYKRNSGALGGGAYIQTPISYREKIRTKFDPARLPE